MTADPKRQRLDDVRPPCRVGREGPYGWGHEEPGKCLRQAQTPTGYCRKHDPERQAEALRRQADRLPELARVPTADLVRELARRGHGQ